MCIKNLSFMFEMPCKAGVFDENLSFMLEIPRKAGVKKDWEVGIDFTLDLWIYVSVYLITYLYLFTSVKTWLIYRNIIIILLYGHTYIWNDHVFNENSRYYIEFKLNSCVWIFQKIFNRLERTLFRKNFLFFQYFMMIL